MYGRIVLAGKDHLTSTDVLKLSLIRIYVLFSGKFRKLIELIADVTPTGKVPTYIWNIHLEPNPFHEDIDLSFLLEIIS
jgi:hypothetical protein